MSKPGRNDTCACGSGKKFKKCCAVKQERTTMSTLMIGVLLAVLAGGVYAVIAGWGDKGSAVAAPGLVWSEAHGHYH